MDHDWRTTAFVAQPLWFIGVQCRHFPDTSNLAGVCYKLEQVFGIFKARFLLLEVLNIHPE